MSLENKFCRQTVGKVIADSSLQSHGSPITGSKLLATSRSLLVNGR
jgi:hypothetical protein